MTIKVNSPETTPPAEVLATSGGKESGHPQQSGQAAGEGLRLDLAQLESKEERKQANLDDTAARLQEVRTTLQLPTEGKAPAVDYEERLLVKVDDAYNNLKRESQREQEQAKFYREAAQKAREFLSKIDPSLKVNVAKVDVMAGQGRYSTFGLIFSSDSDMQMEWGMELNGVDASYFEGHFEQVVRKVYERTKSGEPQTYEGEWGQVEQSVEQELKPTREMDKTERAVAEEAGERINQVLKNYGLQPRGFDLSNIKIVAGKDLHSEGLFRDGKIYISEHATKNLLRFRHIVSHELTHAKTENQLPRWLNEAVVETLNKEALDGGISHIPKVEQLSRESALIKKQLNLLLDAEGRPLVSEEDEVYFTQDGSLELVHLSYGRERRLFRLLQSKLKSSIENNGQRAEQNLLFVGLKGKKSLQGYVDSALGAGTYVHIQSLGENEKAIRDYIASL